MRFLAWLDRRYTPRQTVVMLLPSVIVMLTAHAGAVALGISRPVAATISLIATLGAYFTLAALVDHRTRRD